MIRAIIFDCFGVLYTGSLEYLAQIAPRGRERDVHDINRMKDYGLLSNNEYIGQLSDVLGRSREEIIAIIGRHHVRNDELVRYVRSLKPTYQTALLSNVGDSMMEELFPPAEQAELFDTVVLSYQVGMVKPHPSIFELTAERLGVRPDECVMIDDLASNCEGAEVAGMAAIQHITNELTMRQLATLLGDNHA